MKKASMRKKAAILKIFTGIVLILSMGLFMLTGCSINTTSDNNKLNVVATTTMLTDLVKQIGGEKINVSGLMGTGIDPHSYKPTAGDVTKLQTADIAVVNGLHLEGKMTDVFDDLKKIDKIVVNLEEQIDKSKFYQEEEGVYDPHIWFDVSIWKEAAKAVEKALSDNDEENSSTYKSNLEEYLKQLDELEEYIIEKVNSLPEESRVLVTAHDAFGYFARAYGFEVKGIQGINTQAEAGTADVDNLAQFIADNKIKAIFVESSVSPKTIESLEAAVKAKGFETSIGGELYSDSLGDETSDTETYIKTFKKNIDTIINALK